MDSDFIRSVDPDPYSEAGSGSRRPKFTQKSRKNLDISCFRVLVFIFIFLFRGRRLVWCLVKSSPLSLLKCSRYGAWTKYLSRHQTLNVGFSKKLTSKCTWRQVFICLRPPLPSHPSPRYTLYVLLYIPLYLFTQERGKGWV